MAERRSQATEKTNDAEPPATSGALPGGTLPLALETTNNPSTGQTRIPLPLQAPKTTKNPSTIQTRTRTHSREHGQGASTIAGDNSSGQSEHTSGYTGNIPTHTKPITLTGRTIPLGIRSKALSILLTFAPVRDVTNVSDGFHINAVRNSEAWVGQHVVREAAYPCGRCSRGRGPFLGKPCVIVDGHFKGACAGCHYSVSNMDCSIRERVASTSRIIMDGLDLPQQGKSPSVLDGISLTLEGKEAEVLSPFAHIDHQAIGGRSRSRSPVSYDSLGGESELYLRRARAQSARDRAMSRRRLEAALEAINRAEVEDRVRARRERARRERGRERWEKMGKGGGGGRGRGSRG